MSPWMPSRRALVQGLSYSLAASLWPRRSLAFGDGARFVPAVLQHKGRWDARLSGLRRLAWAPGRGTSVEMVPDARALVPNSPKLFEYPFAYLGGDGSLPAFSAEEIENLRRYLTFGGFLLVDANDGSDGSGF